MGFNGVDTLPEGASAQGVSSRCSLPCFETIRVHLGRQVDPMVGRAAEVLFMVSLIVYPGLCGLSEVLASGRT